MKRFILWKIFSAICLKKGLKHTYHYASIIINIILPLIQSREAEKGDGTAVYSCLILTFVYSCPFVLCDERVFILYF